MVSRRTDGLASVGSLRGTLGDDTAVIGDLCPVDLESIITRKCQRELNLIAHRSTLGVLNAREQELLVTDT